MKITQIRNATLVVEFGDHVLLVDPMLGPKGSGPPFTIFRYRPRMNPVVGMPDGVEGLLERVTHCLVTHLHPDHLDKAAIKWLKERGCPVTCSVKDARKLRKKGLQVVGEIAYGLESEFLGGTIEGVEARHGYGFIAGPMGPVMGYFLRLLGEPSLYLSSDTIYTEEVHRVLKEYRPGVSVVAAGQARLDVFQPLLMRVEEVIQFAKDAPGMVIANHMEAVNHCPIPRAGLRADFAEEGLGEKTWVPEDGASREFE